MATKAHGYFSRDVPGMNILEEFYETFAKGISFEKGGGSFFGGLMNTWVEVLEHGLPLEMDQSVTTSMGGRAMGGENRFLLKVSDLQLVNLPTDFCTRVLTPDYFEVSEVGEGLSGMSMGPGSNSPGAGPEAEGGMSALGGLLDMMKAGGEQGFAVPGAQQAPAAQPAAIPAATAGGTARSTPSSSALTTNNMTQSVQNHLQALGYDPGNTSGDLSTDTIIAISQFQAEKGMDVTGEVTPQLLGILGAEVDSRP
jgi:hypothetical protein